MLSREKLILPAKKAEEPIKYNVFTSRAISCFETFSYDSIKQKFKHLATLISMDSIYLNPQNRALMTTTDGGNFGTHSKTIYRWIKGRLVEIRELQRAFEQEGDNPPMYEYSEYESRNGKRRLLKIYRRSLDEDDDKFYDNWGH